LHEVPSGQSAELVQAVVLHNPFLVMGPPGRPPPGHSQQWPMGAQSASALQVALPNISVVHRSWVLQII
jgi:hypothetical protein